MNTFFPNRIHSALVWLLFFQTCLLEGIRCKVSTSSACVSTHSDASCDADLLNKLDDDRIPKPYEFSIDFDLPDTSFLTLRREMLSDQSEFWINTVMTEALQYSNIQRLPWDKYPQSIGSTQLSPNIDPRDFVGASRKAQYRMPKSLLVDSLMAFETATLTEYSDELFVLQRTTHTPDAPFGNTYIAKTQLVVIKTSDHSCKMMCSVEAQFPKGPPLGMGWPIRKGMRDGTLEGFKVIAQTIRDKLIF